MRRTPVIVVSAISAVAALVIVAAPCGRQAEHAPAPVTDLAAAYFRDRDEAMEKLNQANARKTSPPDDGPWPPEDLRAELAKKERALERAEYRIREFERRFGAGLPAQSTKILAADPVANVIVIGLGRQDGVRVGDRYTVSRGNQYVGTIVVTDVTPKQSAARSSKDLKGSPIRVGDDATSR